MNIDLLKRLAIYLNNLPDDYDHFDMRQYYGYDVFMTPAHATPPSACGTVACAIGHLPFVPDTVKPFQGEGWRDYAYRALLDGERFRILKFEFMFSGYWDTIDNTAQGAAKRIWAIATGQIELVDMVVSKESVWLYKDIEVGRE